MTTSLQTGQRDPLKGPIKTSRFRASLAWSKAAPWLKRVPIAIFLLAIPLFLIASNVRWATNEMNLYEFGFDRYDIPTRTGIEKAELMRSGRQIRAYFNNSEELLDVRVQFRGQEVGLYNDREILHMKDVKGLVRVVYRGQEVLGIYILGYILVGFWLWRRAFFTRLARHVMWGGGLTIALVLLVGLASLVGFDRLFRVFHLLSFANDLWQLDPRRDYLLIMFPQGFFFWATVFIAMATVLEALLLAGIAAALLRWRGRVEGAGEAPGTPEAQGR